MLALGIAIAFFVFLVAVGRAVLALAGYRHSALRAWLLAPSLGLCALLLLLMMGNQAGLPIRSFAGWLGGALALGGAVALWRLRPAFPRRALAPFAILVLVNLFWTGWPALEFGFNWVSYANDDMVNYCLAAERFADRGFWAVPDPIDTNLRDYTQHYWYMHASDLMRFGAEHTLAWLVSITRMQAIQLFMPLILSLAGVQLCAVGALVLHRGRYRRWAYLAAALLAISPLFLLGALYQLIAQVGGLALLLCTIALLTEEQRAGQSLGEKIRRGIPPALTAATLCIFYPEVTPFAVLAFGGFIVISAARRRAIPHAQLSLAIFTLAGVVVLLNYNLLSYMYTFSKQFESAVRDNDLTLSIFPFFLLPTGFSILLGWMPIAHDFAEPWMSLSVLGGMIAVVFAFVSSTRETARGTPIAILAVIQLLMALRLFAGGFDFGLYKLAMFMQPALMAALAWWLLRLPRARVTAWALLGIYAATTVPTALYYASSARGLRSGGITELRYASKLGTSVERPADPHAQVLSGVENVVAAKFVANSLRGHELAFVSHDFFEPFLHINYRWYQPTLQFHPFYKELCQSPILEDLHRRKYTRKATLWRTEFTIQTHLPHPSYMVSLAPQLSLFNKYGLRDSMRPERLFELTPLKRVSNQLIFVHSGRGNHYYLGDRRRIALFQQEPDTAWAGHSVNGLGRFLLLRVENPSEQIYIRIAATRTWIYEKTAWSARGVIHGAQDYPLSLVGNGAFNRWIGPLQPLWLDGAAYLAIDFGETPQVIVDQRLGLKALYNRGVPLDYRRLVGWGRDISALNPTQFAQLKRPTRLARFPEDLVSAEGLEFSGLFEDGWMSPRSEFVLGPARAGEFVRIRGAVPMIPDSPLGTGKMEVSVNGAPALALPATCGGFDWLVPVERAATTTRVSIAFTATAQLPGFDHRPVGAKLELLEIAPAAASSASWNYTLPMATRLASPGIDQDGWAGRQASITLPARSQTVDVFLRTEFPGWSERPQATVNLTLAGQRLQAQIFKPGQHRIRLRLPAGDAPQLLRIEADDDFLLPGSDRRRVAWRLLAMEMRPVDPANQEKTSAQGVDADGWAATNVTITVPPRERKGELTLRLEYPSWSGQPQGAVRLRNVDRTTSQYALPPGETTIRMPVPASPQESFLHLDCNGSFTLPAPDGRRRAYRVASMELSDVFATATQISGPFALASNGVDRDGWAEKKAAFTVPAQSAATEFVLRIEFPGWSGRLKTTLRLQLDGQPEQRHTLKPGIAELRLPVPAAAQTVQIESDGDFALPAPDGRRRAFRVLSAELRPAATP